MLFIVQFSGSFLVDGDSEQEAKQHALELASIIPDSVHAVITPHDLDCTVTQIAEGSTAKLRLLDSAVDEIQCGVVIS